MSFESGLKRGDRGFISECKGQSVPAVGGCDGEGSRAEGEFCAWDLDGPTDSNNVLYTANCTFTEMDGGLQRKTNVQPKCKLDCFKNKHTHTLTHIYALTDIILLKFTRAYDTKSLP